MHAFDTVHNYAMLIEKTRFVSITSKCPSGHKFYKKTRKQQVKKFCEDKGVENDDTIKEEITKRIYRDITVLIIEMRDVGASFIHRILVWEPEGCHAKTN